MTQPQLIATAADGRRFRCPLVRMDDFDREYHACGSCLSQERRPISDDCSRPDPVCRKLTTRHRRCPRCSARLTTELRPKRLSPYWPRPTDRSIVDPEYRQVTRRRQNLERVEAILAGDVRERKRPSAAQRRRYFEEVPPES